MVWLDHKMDVGSSTQSCNIFAEMLKNVKINSATFACHNLISNYVFKGEYIKID